MFIGRSRSAACVCNNRPRRATPAGPAEDSFGPELLVDGVDFASGYANLAGTNNTGGKVNLVSGSLPRATLALVGTLTAGKTFELAYTISSYSAGTIQFIANAFLTGRTSDGTYIERFTAAGTESTLQVRGSSSGRASVDDCSLREVDPELSALTWQSGSDPLIFEGMGAGFLVGETSGRSVGSTLPW
jgi:hypothetical protein